MELLLSKIATPGDGEDGEEGIGGVIVEWIWGMIIVVLQVDAALE